MSRRLFNGEWMSRVYVGNQHLIANDEIFEEFLMKFGNMKIFIYTTSRKSIRGKFLHQHTHDGLELLNNSWIFLNKEDLDVKIWFGLNVEKNEMKSEGLNLEALI